MISGKYRGRLLKQPSKEICRSTTDRVREAIFSMIQFKVKNAIVLDAFAGSGAFGIESVSREATKVFCIEKNEKASKVIKENIENLQIYNLKIINEDATKTILKMKNMKFDLIFLDPPYKKINLYNEVLDLISKTKILKKFGFIIVECIDLEKLNIPENFIVQKIKKYGSTNILLLANNI